jgi:spore maturation protein CgeB
MKAFLMLKEKLLRIFLSIPLLAEITELVLAILIKRKGLKVAFKDLRNQLNPRNSNFHSNYKDLENFHWIIQISAPRSEDSKLWGDTHFAQEIAASLKKLNQTTDITFRNDDVSKLVQPNSVVLNLRGLLPATIVPRRINAIWVISHPDQLTKHELKKYDLAFAASTSWALIKTKKWQFNVKPLLQATNPEIFNTEFTELEKIDRLLFVGNTRGKFREIVKISNKISRKLRVIGTGWEKYLDDSQIEKQFVENKNLATEYKKSSVVLADHWEDMAKNGFISNRIFDSVASGSRVISDQVEGIEEIFGNSVVTYQNAAELEQILNRDCDQIFGDQDQLSANALKIQKDHNFDARAKVLLAEVKNLIRK